MAGDSEAVQTIDNSSAFREGFHRLFSQKFTDEKFELIVQPIGPVSQAKKYLQKLADHEVSGVVLIDLDGPKAQKDTRLQSYSPADTSRLFFMIQEMEAWILSQPEKLDEYAMDEGLTRKRGTEKIANDALIRNIHPEELADPAAKLNTLFRKYFSIQKKRGGKVKDKPKSYSKIKDGPQLIARLKLDSLVGDFDEAQSLVARILGES